MKDRWGGGGKILFLEEQKGGPQKERRNCGLLKLTSVYAGKLDDEHSTKTFLTLENGKSSYNNVSHLMVEEEIIDDSTTPLLKI